MLPLFPDLVLVSMGSHAAHLLRIRRGVRPTLAHKASLGLPEGSLCGDWINDQLKQDVKAGSRVKVVVGGERARYALLEWSEALSGEAETQAYIDARLSAMYGDTARNWVSSWQLQSNNMCLVSALDRRCLQELQAGCQAMGLDLVSVQPALMTYINAWRKRLKRRPVCLLMAERERLTLALSDGVEWQYVHAQRVDITSAKAVSVLLEREMLRAGMDSAKLGGERSLVVVGHAVALPDTLKKHAEYWTPDVLTGLDPIRDIDFSVLSGLY